MPPSAMTGTPKRLAYSATLYTEVPWGRPHAMTGGIKQIRHDYHGNHPGGKTKQMPSVFLTLKTSKRVLLLQHIFSRQGTLTQRDSLVPMATTEHGPWPITMTTVRGLRVIGFHWQLLLLLSHRGSGLDHEQVQQVQSWLVKTGVTGRGRAGVTTAPSGPRVDLVSCPGSSRGRLPSCVMQMEPQPMPTLRASTPASIRFFAWAAVTTGTENVTVYNRRIHIH